MTDGRPGGARHGYVLAGASVRPSRCRRPASVAHVHAHAGLAWAATAASDAPPRHRERPQARLTHPRRPIGTEHLMGGRPPGTRVADAEPRLPRAAADRRAREWPTQSLACTARGWQTAGPRGPRSPAPRGRGPADPPRCSSWGLWNIPQAAINSVSQPWRCSMAGTCSKPWSVKDMPS